MPEVVFNGPDGRLEGRYQPSQNPSAPVALILHPHPRFGGTMNDNIVYQLFYLFHKRGFSSLRFNFRGIGRSEGEFDHGEGELSDAAAALDWVQNLNPESKHCWIAGYSFGAWIGMQLLMRRPEIKGFISISPQPRSYDFSFLAPCPSSGLIINGSCDTVADETKIKELVEKLMNQKGIVITHKVIPDANHFFIDKVDDLINECSNYIDQRISTEWITSAPVKRLE
ncbi:alpha/beta hydrolase [Candidatus Liberibacter americanus]|uniref:Hydrolase of the alpha/beta superfamily n=1 Tax=Candidatus Liberibacter americanus str. Sao Paulo TaxID=1261131 RepID=U6B5G7_9HYPH|nr:alpha/beta hydrolase [Candidatus Liberibacter americanus]AHA27973.1 hydrolase of the alpha/beta superfamily [Candidatus Liberibacter americanus str. Sao Paulo]EMS35872.1 alpha/beta hydrolase [Candidatus Liberibacter americanus PW_SP]